MNLLAIETATEACSVAVTVEDEIVTDHRIAPRMHTQLVLAMVEEVLHRARIDKSTLDAVAFGRGPGSFTGVRIAAGVAQGIAFALELPVYPVSTLAALAQGALRSAGTTSVAAAIDARRGEVYWGCYRADGSTMQLVGKEAVLAPTATSIPEAGSWCGVGSGWGQHSAELLAHHKTLVIDSKPEALPQAHDIAVLGKTAACADAGKGIAMANAALALPVYLRDKVVD